MAGVFASYPIEGGGGVTSLNGLTGALTLVAGSGISITPSGSNITIASTASGANTALSNLAAVAINTDLVYGSAVTGVLKTKDATGTTDLTISTGNASAGNSGALHLNAGTATGVQGDVFISGRELHFFNGDLSQMTIGTNSVVAGATLSISNAGTAQISLEDRNVSQIYSMYTSGDSALTFDDTTAGRTPFKIIASAVSNALVLNTGSVDIAATLTMSRHYIENVHGVSFVDAGLANKLYIQSPTSLSGTTIWELPDGNGSAGAFLSTNGSTPTATLSWVVGVSGSFTSQDGKTITVTNGLITAIV